MKSVRYLTFEDFAIIIEEYRNHFKNFSDPLPDMTSCHTEKLESIIAIPQKTFSGKDLYSSLYEKAACYFYFINKLHPFYNGNKRMSVFVTTIFLMMNGMELKYDNEQMYALAKSVTLSDHDQTKKMKALSHDLKKHARRMGDPWAPLRNTWYLVTSLFKSTHRR
ncbi:MAG TPA: type II toxin-antitoxin system death-on-curing family toxin [Candidatus Woesebacteria bacterium]|nr:type II toxin-antitoxin system death-on-curing family toxin [Candidatus Woesebacteria bacterium]HNS94495.1 type II toxin-antitoxin system death-on-curing family toxin [Candidatus Woesebacteria bacterium]